MKINPYVSWVGIQDPEIQHIHGDTFDTKEGTSYNAYLIQSEKTVLIDTVFIGKSDVFIQNLELEIDLEAIDYIVIQHGEIDHSGALPALMERIPNTPIVCTEECMHTLKGHYHETYNYHLVRTGDHLDIGNGQELFFIEMKMLHWPDSMATYLTKENILFSNDVFGQHLTVENSTVSDENLSHVLEAAQKYYVSIISPFGKMMAAKLKQIASYNFNIKTIAPSHGYIWTDHSQTILKQYKLWSEGYTENLVVIFYDTMWNGTKILAQNISDGMLAEDHTLQVELHQVGSLSDSDLMHLIFKSRLLVLGSPTMNNTYMPSISKLIHQIKGLRFKHKSAACFGCYGWSGEATKQMKEQLRYAGLSVIDQELTCMWHPDEEKIYQAQQYGRLLAKKIRA